MLPAGHPPGRKTATVGLRSLFTRHKKPAPTRTPAPAQVQTVVREPLTPEQLAELNAARAEFLHVAEEAGLKSFRACSVDASRWQDDLETVRAMTALIKETQLRDEDKP